MKHSYLKSIAAVFALCASVVAAPAMATPAGHSTLRDADLSVQPPAAPMKNYVRNSGIQKRQMVEQPPLIPHNIRNFQTDKNFNKCLACHSWENADKWGAPKISVTHFKNRHDEFLADVAPGRYFCLQCHVPQVDAKPLVGNTFKAVDSLHKSSDENH